MGTRLRACVAAIAILIARSPFARAECEPYVEIRGDALLADQIVERIADRLPVRRVAEPDCPPVLVASVEGDGDGVMLRARDLHGRRNQRRVGVVDTAALLLEVWAHAVVARQLEIRHRAQPSPPGASPGLVVRQGHDVERPRPATMGADNQLRSVGDPRQRGLQFAGELAFSRDRSAAAVRLEGQRCLAATCLGVGIRYLREDSQLRANAEGWRANSEVVGLLSLSRRATRGAAYFAPRVSVGAGLIAVDSEKDNDWGAAARTAIGVEVGFVAWGLFHLELGVDLEASLTGLFAPSDGYDRFGLRPYLVSRAALGLVF